MRICFIPIDNRPVCYTLAKDIAAIDLSIELLLPPRDFLGDLTRPADIKRIIDWLEFQECNSLIVSLDTIAYGGLVSSRRGKETLDVIKDRINMLKQIIEKKNAKVYAFSSIMRISNNNYNEEEKEYWDKYGKKIFEYSYNTDKDGNADSSVIPADILEDYLETRKRNFEINKIYLEWQKEGFFDTLIFSKDDCAEYGFNVKEAKELEELGGYIKTGADEIPLTLLSRALTKEIKVFIKYTEPEYINLISNYEDVSVEKSVLGQLELGGFKVAKTENEADVVLIVNNFREKQGELVMGWKTEMYSKTFTPPDKPYAVADIRFANGADNRFVEQLLSNITPQFFGYSGWNTTANTLGSLLAGVKVLYCAKNCDKNAFDKLQMIRFLDDWAYQANVRGQISIPCNIEDLMKPYAERLSRIFDYKSELSSIKYTYPWDRKFEVEISLD